MNKLIEVPTLLRLMRFWPAYLGAGVRVTKVSNDVREVEVKMNLHKWNSNYIGTHFGGSLYSMVDPFYVLMLLQNLGRDYIVVDKEAIIRFKAPGKGPVHAKFLLTQEIVDEIRAKADTLGKTEPQFQVQILDDSGNVVAEVDKLLSVRRKDRAKPAGQETTAAVNRNLGN